MSLWTCLIIWLAQPCRERGHVRQPGQFVTCRLVGRRGHERRPAHCSASMKAPNSRATLWVTGRPATAGICPSVSVLCLSPLGGLRPLLPYSV